MKPPVKFTPPAFQAMLLHFAVDIKHEMKGLLMGLHGETETVVLTIVPLSSNQDANNATVASRSRDIDFPSGTRLSVVGWYHSHKELDLNLTDQDIDFHSKFQEQFPNAIAFVGLFGRCSNDKAAMMSFAAFRFGLDAKPFETPCLIKPLLPSPLSSKYYAIACLALEDVLKVAEDHVVSRHNDELNCLASGIFMPILLTLRSMVGSSAIFCPK